MGATTMTLRLDLLALTLVAFSVLVACSPSSDAKPPASVASVDSAARAELADRLDDSTKLLTEFREKFPPSVARSTRCVVVVPAMVKGGVLLGAKHGNGFAACRTSTGWSAPAPISVSGGGAGLQVGLESVDVVMLVMTDDGMNKVLRSKFVLGADVSVSAGPVGRGREADTDTALKTEVLSYTRSRGLFAGAELSGAHVEQDNDATQALYERSAVEFRAILRGEVPAPSIAQRFLDALRASFS
jgi:lipid-binding SYLF domain-containing protein